MTFYLLGCYFKTYNTSIISVQEQKGFSESVLRQKTTVKSNNFYSTPHYPETKQKNKHTHYLYKCNYINKQTTTISQLRFP